MDRIKPLCPEDVFVRPYAPRDRDQVMELWHVCGLTVPQNDPAKDIERKLECQADLFLVAESRGAVVGSAMAGYEGHRGWIYYLGVAPALRRRRIGRMLVAECEARLARLGCPKVNLMVRAANASVCPFYERLGYVRDDVECLGKRLIVDGEPPMCRAQSPSAPKRAVSIRPFRLKDAQALFDAAVESCGHVYPWLPWCRPGYTMDEAVGWLRHCRQSWATGSEFNFAIVDSAGALLGGCGLNRLDGPHRTANLGYWVRSSALGMGVATQAVGKLVSFAFGNTDLRRLEIVASVANIASCRVAEKSGAIREGIARSRLVVHGVSHDAAIYSFVKPIRAAA